MVQLTLTVAAAVASVLVVLWLVGAQEPAYRISRSGAIWFVALRGVERNVLAPGMRTLWAADSDFALIGAEAPYWSRFLIVSGEGRSPLRSEHFEDAYVARLRLLTPPPLALGFIKLLVWTRLLSRPSIAEVSHDGRTLGFRAELMPSASAIAALLGQPAGYAPAIGFIHTGKPLSFVYDIADLFKFETVVPVAFATAAQDPRAPEQLVRLRCRDSFRETHLLRNIIPTIEEVLAAGGLEPPPPPEDAQPPAIPEPPPLGDAGHRG